MADLANSVSSGKSLSHYGPYFFFWKGERGGHEQRVSFLLHSWERERERITVGGRNTHMLWLRRADSFRTQREERMGGGRGRERGRTYNECHCGVLGRCKSHHKPAM